MTYDSYQKHAEKALSKVEGVTGETNSLAKKAAKSSNRPSKEKSIKDSQLGSQMLNRHKTSKTK